MPIIDGEVPTQKRKRFKPEKDREVSLKLLEKWEQKRCSRSTMFGYSTILLGFSILFAITDNISLVAALAVMVICSIPFLVCFLLLQQAKTKIAKIEAV